ncbi:hypothetical protein D3C84_1240400 [compost metagenome]
MQPRGPLGHRLADEQRDDRAAEAHDQREAEQRREVEAVGREEAIDAEQAGDHAEHRDDHHVGQDEQKDTFQVEFSVGKSAT